jgi:5-(aminomethyl)-3-furanmethanol phosphate kinase
VLTVVKVGGGLVREAGDAALRALCAEIAAVGRRHRLLVVPGGGEFADAVRRYEDRAGLDPEAAHWMAILAMDQFGWALAGRIPGAERRTGLDATGSAPGVAVLLPYALLRERDPLPASWAVTADSIAAWVAGEAGAGRLVLVKPVAGLHATWPPEGGPIAGLTVGELAALRTEGVDAHLPAALRAARVETWVIDGREPRRLAELLDTGRTAGTRVAPAA